MSHTLEAVAAILRTPGNRPYAICPYLQFAWLAELTFAEAVVNDTVVDLQASAYDAVEHYSGERWDVYCAMTGIAALQRAGMEVPS